jgi:ATPase subunit of ABC transporter with duplicated ATPase domains
MSKNSLLVGQDLSYSIGSRQLFNNLTISFGKEKTGLIGRNGTGKSTLIKLLMGFLKPDAGSVYRNCKIGYLPQDFITYSYQSIADVLGIKRKLCSLERIESGDGSVHDYDIVGDDWDVVSRTEALFAKLGLSHLNLHRKMGSLSGGETTRVVFASLFLSRPDFLILDEPTNNLDRDSRQALYDLITEFKGGILVVSHDRKLLSLMDQIVELTSLGVKTYGGNYEQYVAQKESEQQAKLRQLSDAQKALRKTKKVVQQTKEKYDQRAKIGREKRKAKSHPKMFLDYQKGRSEKTKSKLEARTDAQLDQAREMLRGAKEGIEENKFLNIDMRSTYVHNSKLVLEIKDLCFSYIDGRILFNNFNLSITGPRRIAFVGPNGCGKTTLLKLITKELELTSGIIKIGVERFAYLDQNVKLLDREQTIIENFKHLNPDATETDCRLRLAAFLFEYDDALKVVKNLSSGERLRAALACLLMGNNALQLIVLDEPTNHMDLSSIQSMEQALQKYKGAIVVVSHDETFLKNIGVEDKIKIG